MSRLLKRLSFIFQFRRYSSTHYPLIVTPFVHFYYPYGIATLPILTVERKKPFEFSSEKKNYCTIDHCKPVLTGVRSKIPGSRLHNRLMLVRRPSNKNRIVYCFPTLNRHFQYRLSVFRFKHTGATNRKCHRQRQVASM